MSSITLSTHQVAHVSSEGPRVPWYLWFGALAVTSASIGGAWDVSWHRSIGRDTFWTPAHMAIYACGSSPPSSAATLSWPTPSASSAKLKAASVNVLGFRAPLGAFIAAWGGIAMLTSAPFDNWWHAAYGLDVKIVSPPHTLLILGIRAVVGRHSLSDPRRNESRHGSTIRTPASRPTRGCSASSSTSAASSSPARCSS